MENVKQDPDNAQEEITGLVQFYTYAYGPKVAFRLLTEYNADQSLDPR